jgi:hypothetical protein
MPTKIDPVTGKTKRLPYPGDPGYAGAEGAPVSGSPQQPAPRPTPNAPADPAAVRRRRTGRPKERQVSAGPQVPARNAQVGPSLAGDPSGLGYFGSLGAVPGVAEQGAVTGASVLPHERRRRGLLS